MNDFFLQPKKLFSFILLFLASEGFAENRRSNSILNGIGNISVIKNTSIIRFIRSAAIILCLHLISYQVSAQSSEFKTIEALYAAFVQNDKQIGNKSTQIGKIRDNQLDKADEIFALQPLYFNAAKEATDARDIWISKQNEDTNFPVIAADEIKKLKEIYREKIRKFGILEIRIKSLKSRLKSLMRAEKSGDLALLKLKKRRLEILGQSEFFNAPFVSDVMVLRDYEGLYERDTLYSKSWQSNKDLEAINFKIENLLSTLKEFEAMVIVAEKRVTTKRDEFNAIHESWEAKNNEYGSYFMTEAFYRITLEIIDVAIATKMGSSAPEVAFELFWRWKDAGNPMKNNEEFAFEIPKVSETYIEHMKSLGKAVDGGSKVANANGRSANIVDYTIYGDSFFSKVGDNEIGEFWKSAFGFTATTLAEAKIQRNLAKDASWWSLYMTSNGNWDDAFKAYKNKGGDVFDTFKTLRNHLRQGDDTFYTMLTNTIKSTDYKWDAFVDLGVSMGYTFAKDAVIELRVNERFKVYQELAKLEIIWLTKRNEFNKAMWFREQQKEILHILYEELGRLYAEKYKACCASELVTHQNLDISTSQISGNTKLKLLLKMSESIQQGLRVSFNGQSKSMSVNSSSDNNLIHQIEIEKLFDDIENFEGGEMTLVLKAKSDKNISLDGNPQTLAVYHVSANGWEGLESIGAGDQTHTINFVKPKLSMDIESILPKPEKVPIEVSFLSVNSFIDAAFIAIYPVSDPDVTIEIEYFSPEILNGKVNGTVTLMASLESGDYEVRLDDGFGDFAAKADLSVRTPKGLLHMKAFDKEDKETDYYVRIFKEEEADVLRGISGVDLTEELDVGNYKLFFSVDSENIERHVEIKKGETTHIEIHLKEDEKAGKEDDDKKEPDKPEEDVFLMPAPPNWSNGVLYNSNDSDCSYGGQYLVFMSAGQRGSGRFLNRETAEFSQFVAVAPGGKLEVAVPANSVFIRVFSTNVLPEDLSTVPWNSISHGTMSNLEDGWWYQAGCKNGTKPKSRCDNGTGSGPPTHYSCSTRGED